MFDNLRLWWQTRGMLKDMYEEPGENKDKRAEALQKKKERKEKENVQLYTLTYDENLDEYTLDLKTKVERKDAPHSSVHVTGKKRMYLDTNIWNELIWPEKGQSAIHMYLWMINNSITGDILTQKKPGMDLDWHKIILYGAIIIAIIIIAPSFIHR